MWQIYTLPDKKSVLRCLYVLIHTSGLNSGSRCGKSEPDIPKVPICRSISCTKMKLWTSKHLSKWTQWPMKAKMRCDPYSLTSHKIWIAWNFNLKLGDSSLLPQRHIWCNFEQNLRCYPWSTGWVGMEWPIKFHCSCATCKHRFFSEIFCTYSFSPKTNKFNPVPVQFSNLSK